MEGETMSSRTPATITGMPAIAAPARRRARRSGTPPIPIETMAAIWYAVRVVSGCGKNFSSFVTSR
jgi:hypothetical protein